MKTEKIAVYKMDTFLAKLNAVNKTAIKCGMVGISFQILGDIKEYNDISGESVITGKEVEITYQDTVQLPGDWMLIAVLDHTEGLIKVVPGEYLPEIYRERGNICDHCNSNRPRNRTFVVMSIKDDEYYQVGSSCIHDFLGIDPSVILNQLELTESIEFDEEWTGSRTPTSFKLDSYLTNVACMIRLFGWVSRTGQNESNYSTADHAAENMLIDPNKKDRFGNVIYQQPTEADKDLAEATIEWMKELGKRQRLNDYLFNISKIADNEYVTFNSIGYAASAISAYMREIENNKPKGGDFIGEVGDKIIIEVTLMRSFGNQVAYNTYSYKHYFQDADGNTIKWGTGNQLSIGQKYKIKATIKELEVYQGTPQTVITRGTVLE